jgi:hypothetical protein
MKRHESAKNYGNEKSLAHRIYSAHVSDGQSGPGSKCGASRDVFRRIAEDAVLHASAYSICLVR